MKRTFWLCFFALICALAVFAEPKIIYSKTFKGSTPEYVQIVVERSGQVTYKESPDDDQPLHCQLTPADTTQIFDLADRLDHFSRPLESPAKVAFMGMKTFRFEDPPKQSEVKFNYSEDPNARLLVDWFERIAETELDYIDLERTVKFDKLGVNQVLLNLEVSYDHKRLIAPEQFLPLLDRINKNESFMHMSRERAAKLAELFRNPPAQTGNK